jgi:membrane protein
MVYSLIISALISLGLIVGSFLHNHFSVYLLINCLGIILGSLIPSNDTTIPKINKSTFKDLTGEKRVGLVAMSLVFMVMFISVILSFIQSTTSGIVNLVLYAIFMLTFYFCSNSSIVNESLGLRVPYRGIMGTALMPSLLFVYSLFSKGIILQFMLFVSLGYTFAILIRLIDILGTPIAFPFVKDNISLLKIDKSANAVAYNVSVIGIGILLFLIMLIF